MTGDRPTGKLHLGHLVGSMRSRVRLQNVHDRSFYMVADIQALTDNADNPDKVRRNAFEVVLDNLAVGLSPERTIFFIQSQIPEIAELTVLFLNLVTLARLKRNPTIKSEMLQKGFGENVPAGFLTYPVSQAADILTCGGTIIPVGEDQLPMIEQTNEIVAKFNATYGETFRRVHPELSLTPRLVGTDGGAKAGKSLGNAIYLSDSADDIVKKVMSMYTDPGHLHASDPGRVEGNVVFTYLDVFDHDQKTISELKERYAAGGLGDIALKKRLIDVLESVIAPIRSRRNDLAKDQARIESLLKEGTSHTREMAAETMKRVRKAVRIDYFSF